MNVPLGDTYYFLFTTRNFSTGAPYTLAGTPVLSVYEENNATQITSGVSVSVDYDSVTGLNQATIVATSGNGYEVGKYYSVVVTTGTVNSVSVVGEVIGHFRIMAAENNAGQQAVDAVSVGGTSQTGNDLFANLSAILVDTNSLNDTKIPYTLNLTASGNIGIDWANVENPTTAVDLSATDIQLVDTCTTNTDMRGTDSAYTGTPPTSAAISDAVWDEVLSGHLTGGTTGYALNAAGAAGDPWSTSLPGAYGAGTAGYIVGTNLDSVLSTMATNISSILTDTGTTLPATLSTIGTNVSSILTDTGTTIPAQITGLNNIAASDITGATVETNGTVTLAESLSLILSAVGGELSISGTTFTFKDPSGTSTRISGTADSSGQRSAITLSP